MTKGRGWYNHPQQHALASMGYKIKFDRDSDAVENPPPEDIFPIKWENISKKYEHIDSEKAIMLFWWCSLEGNSFDYFDFDKFFTASRKKVEKWFKSHYSEKYFNMLNTDFSNWRNVLERIWADDKTSLPIQTLIGSFGDEAPKKMQKMYEDILEGEKKKKSEMEKISLVDRIIHTEHQSGNIFGVDIEHAREYFEKHIL